jgi:hypothetical protein
MCLRRRLAARPLGRDVIFDYLRAAGVDRLFGLPGANKVPIVDGTKLTEHGTSHVQCLHENIAMVCGDGPRAGPHRAGVWPRLYRDPPLTRLRSVSLVGVFLS